MVTGGVTRHLEEALRKNVLCCSKSKDGRGDWSLCLRGNIFGQTYATHGGVDKIVPVYVYVPGCPPRPQAIIEGVLMALDQYEALSKKGELFIES
ncbi:hypothetical protein GCM10020331_011450 [Ectobacillus funiculus]